MTMYYTDFENRALENEARLRAIAARVERSERGPDETQDEYHARIWVALRQAAQN